MQFLFIRSLFNQRDYGIKLPATMKQVLKGINFAMFYKIFGRNKNFPK